MDVSTSILDLAPLDAPSHGKPGPGGYDLLDTTWGPEYISWFHERTGILRLGATSARALHNLLSTVAASAGRHDIFGAMLDLVDLRRFILCRLADDQTPWARPSRDVDDWVAFGQQACHQRIEQSAALHGGPRLQGQLPYGVTQLVSMLGGLVATLHGIVDFALPDRPGSFQPHRHRPALVVLTADDAVQVKLAGGVPIFQVGAAAAMSVPHLALLFHELGHILFRRLFEHELDDVDADVLVMARKAVAARGEVNEITHREILLRRFLGFVGDVSAHATWRRLGCESIEAFEQQWLLAQAMGMRDDNLRERRAQAQQAWAEGLLHLRLQRALAANGENLQRALRRTWDAVMDVAGWQAWLLEHRRAWQAELTQPDPGESGRPTVEDVAKALAVETRDYACLLRVWNCAQDHAAQRLGDRTQQFFFTLDHLIKVLQGSEDTLRGTGYDQLDPDIRAGRAGLTPPWTCVDAHRETPAPQAFLWARRILGSAVDAMAGDARRPPGACLGIQRDSHNHSCGPGGDSGLKPGAWADHRGRLFVVGSDARAYHLRVQAAALTALGALGWRVRAGSLRRFIGYPRQFTRTRLGDGAWARLRRSGGEEYWVPLLDSSPVAIGCDARPPEEQQVELAVLLSQQQAQDISGGRSVTAHLEQQGADPVLWVRM